MGKQGKKLATWFVVLVVGSGFVGPVAQATDPNEVPVAGQAQGAFLNDPDLTSESPLDLDNGQLFLQMTGAVLLVLALAAAVFYLSKKVLPRIANAAGKEIRIVETAYLGPRKALHLVEIGHQRLLIGSTNEHIATLAHVGDAWLDLPKPETDPTVST